MHDVSMTPFYTFMVLILPFWSYVCILPQCIKARAWASGSGFWNLKPSPSPLQALVRAQLGLGLNRMGSVGSGLEARRPLIIPIEARSEFPKIQCLMSGHILTILGPLVSGWVIWDSLFREFWCPDGDLASAGIIRGPEALPSTSLFTTSDPKV